MDKFDNTAPHDQQVLELDFCTLDDDMIVYHIQQLRFHTDILCTCLSEESPRWKWIYLDKYSVRHVQLSP